MNDYTISKRMITITIDEDMFKNVYDALMYVSEETVPHTGETWKFFNNIYEELV